MAQPKREQSQRARDAATRRRETLVSGFRLAAGLVALIATMIPAWIGAMLVTVAVEHGIHSQHMPTTAGLAALFLASAAVLVTMGILLLKENRKRGCLLPLAALATAVISIVGGGAIMFMA